MKPRTAARKDANHTELVNHWLSLPGTSWQETYQIPSALDGIAGCNLIDQRIEIKPGDEPPSRHKLTSAESDEFRDWRGRRPIIWLNKADVELTWHVMRKESHEQKT